MAVEVYTFGALPEVEFEEGGLLYGFNSDTFGWESLETQRAKALYAALGVDPDDEEYGLGSLPDGRWALVGLTITGWKFAIEASISTGEDDHDD